MGKFWRKKRLRLTTDSGVLMDGLDLGRALVHFPAVSLLLLPFIEIGTVFHNRTPPAGHRRPDLSSSRVCIHAALTEEEPQAVIAITILVDGFEQALQSHGSGMHTRISRVYHEPRVTKGRTNKC